MKKYIRKPLFDALQNGLKGEPNLLQVIVGPRQVGKTTLALQLCDRWSGPKLYETADLPSTPTAEWIVTQWNQCRALYRKRRRKTLLVLDEIQKIPRWSEAVKKLFDEDRRSKKPVRAVLLGSSSLLMQKGLRESLAGRFELHRHNRWSFLECREYFNLSLQEYLYFGGYPGAIPLRKDEQRWARYIRDSLIETVLSKDVILMSPVSKPALLRQVFGVSISHAAEIISYQKMMGQLQDAGNTTTVASYIDLLSNAYLLTSLQRYSGSKIRRRSSIPKILVLDNALITATAGKGFRRSLKDKASWGRLIENAVGSKLYSVVENLAAELFYWRDRNDEVDYVVRVEDKLVAIEVKSGIPSKPKRSLDLFARRYKNTVTAVVGPQPAGEQTRTRGGNGRAEDRIYVSLEEFFLDPYGSISC